MARRRKLDEDEKKPAPAATEDGSGSFDNTSDTINSTTKTFVNQEILDEEQFDDSAKGRHFWYVVYPTEEYVKANFPDCGYDGSSGWGTAPDDWVEQLRQTGLAFCVSPLHYRDINPDGMPKKPHWHVIVSWGNTTTYRSARALCDMLKSPRPKLLHNVTGAYRYHKHLDNPEKFQYAGNNTFHNGWTPPLDSSEVTRIKREIKDIVLQEDVREYAELLIVCEGKGQEYFDVAVNNTIYCERLCASYRHSPIRVLMRYYNELDDGELKDEIEKRIEQIAVERKNEYESNRNKRPY